PDPSGECCCIQGPRRSKGIRLLSMHRQFFLTRPSRFSTRLIVLSEGNGSPCFLSSHLMAETPIWAYGASASCCRVKRICSFDPLSISKGLVLGARDCSLNQSCAPVL